MIDRSRIPSNIGEHQHLMNLTEPRERPTPQREYSADHSRRDWILFERSQLARADRQPHLRLDVLCYVSQMKHANLFWRDVLASKIDALFFLERDRDYEQDNDHRNRCKQLADARIAAGYDHVHSAG